MINDFFKKFLTNNHIMDDYGLKYNYNYEYEVNKITNEYSAALLSNKILIKCSGLDAEIFLNTQFTNDIKNLEKDEIILSGYCSPKGRLISVFYIFQSDKDYYLYTTLDTADALLKKLNMYKMMSKVEFNISKKILIGLNNIDKSKLPDYLLNIPERYGTKIDIMIEAKMKELSIQKLYEKYPQCNCKIISS